MKMKVLLSVIVFTLYTVSYAQNMKMIDTSMPKKDKKDAVVIEYDSLTNIRPYKDASYYKTIYWAKYFVLSSESKFFGITT